MNWTIFFLGLTLGLKHALEADHLAAVAALTTRVKTLRGAAGLGASWGLGHTTILVAVGAVLMLGGLVIPQWLATLLEMAVGVMLVVLGADVLRRFFKNRVHFHLHRHNDGQVHLHAHSHKEQPGHTHHDHTHASGLSLRAFLVGLMHGMAGSAALIILTLSTLNSLREGLIYLGLFGVGSLVGMALLSVMIAIPLKYSALYLSRFNDLINGLLGTATIFIGLVVLFRTGFSGMLF